MKGLALLLKLAAAGALQAVMPTAPWLGGMRAPLLLAIALHYSLTRDRGFALFAAILAGLLQDALGRTPLGVSSFVFGGAMLMVGRFRADLFRSASVTQATLGALTGAGVTLALWMLLALAGWVRLSAGQGIIRVLGVAVMGALTAPLAIRVAERLDEALGLIPADRR